MGRISRRTSATDDWTSSRSILVAEMSSSMCFSFVVPDKGVIPCSCAIRNSAWAGVQPFAAQIAPTLACLRRLGDPDRVQNDLHGEFREVTCSRSDDNSLVLDPVFLTIRPDVIVPVVSFVPPVLHDIHAAAAVALESLQHCDVIGVAHADLAHDARVLKPDECAPCGEGLCESLER